MDFAKQTFSILSEMNEHLCRIRVLYIFWKLCLLCLIGQSWDTCTICRPAGHLCGCSTLYRPEAGFDKDSRRIRGCGCEESQRAGGLVPKQSTKHEPKKHTTCASAILWNVVISRCLCYVLCFIVFFLEKEVCRAVWRFRGELFENQTVEDQISKYGGWTALPELSGRPTPPRLNASTNTLSSS